MRVAWRRAALPVLVSAIGGLLTSCHAEGIAELRSDGRVAVDITIRGPVDCAETVEAYPLLFASQGGAFGESECRIRGVAPVGDLEPLMSVERIGGLKVLSIASTERLVNESVDLTLRVPGEIIGSNRGEVRANTVRITRFSDLRDGLRVVAQADPGPPSWVVALGWGVAAGFGLGFASAALLRRARRGQALAAGAGDASETEASEQRRPEQEDSNPVDHTWFSLPPAEEEPFPAVADPGRSPSENRLTTPFGPRRRTLEPNPIEL